MKEFQVNWHVLARRYFDSEIAIENTYQLLCQQYGQEQRYYHNLDHIAALFTKANEHQLFWQEADLVHFAIWFHDVIYDARRSDNEQKSAELALKVLKKESSLQEPQLEYIERLILSTEKHTVLLDHNDCRLFLDLDLSILGETWQVYEQYTTQIRQEYRHIPLPLYQKGRSQVLERFLNRTNIYYTSYFEQALEKQARSNIQQELKQLI